MSKSKQNITKKKSSTNLPKTKLKRLGLAGKTAIKVGAKELSHQITKNFKSSEKKQQSKEKKDEQIAKDIFKALSNMKGLAIKFAQFLSLENHDMLSPAFQKELDKANYQVSPINKALIRKIIHTELGEYPETLFKSFDLDPIAAASIGQVHKAILKTGETVAIKVQYPGIDQSILSDLSILKFVIKSAPLLKNLSQKQILNDIVKELEETLPTEINYIQELENINYFQKLIDPNKYVIPKTYPKYSTKHILCMEFLEGKHIPEWIETKPNQTQKNTVAQHLFDFKQKSLIVDQKIHADPNFGNFLVLPDERIGIIDFGCVRKIEPEFAKYLPKILHAYTQENWQEAWDTYAKLKMIEKNTAYPKELEAFGEWIARPYKNKTFDFKENKLYSNESQKQFHTLNKFKRIHPNYVFFTRLHLGIYQIAKKLDATISMQSLAISTIQ